MVSEGESGGRGLNYEPEMNKYALLYVKYITKKDLL